MTARSVLAYGYNADGAPEPLRNAAVAALDLFGRMRISEPAVVFASSPEDGAQALTWQTMASGAGNGAAWNANTRAIDMTLAAAGYVVRQSYAYVRYELGRPVRVILTGNWGNDVATTRERGQFDAANGVYWQRRPDGTFAVGVRSSTSGTVVNTIIEVADWNGDAVAITPSHNNVFLIEYVWLGAFAVRWGVATGSGVKYVHTEVFADRLAASYMQTATLPLRDAIYADAAPASPATMQIVCAQVESEGGYLLTPTLPWAGRRTVANVIAAATAPNEAPIVAVRPALLKGSGGVVNRATILVDEVEIYSTAAADWSVWYFPPGTANPITGGAWAAANPGAAVEVNASGTALNLSGGYRIASGVAVASGTGGSARGATASQVQQVLPLTLDICGANSPLTSNVGANPGYIVLAATGTGNVSGAINGRQL